MATLKTEEAREVLLELEGEEEKQSRQREAGGASKKALAEWKSMRMRVRNRYAGMVWLRCIPGRQAGGGRWYCDRWWGQQGGWDRYDVGTGSESQKGDVGREPLGAAA